MNKEENQTHKEHYVPVVYLKGFSKDGKRIHYYDFRNDKATIEPVPIKSILYEKDLYEVRNSEKEIIYANRVEKVLQRLEIRFSTYLKRLQNKVFIPDNYRSNRFFDEDEIEFWITYTIIQLLRTPKVLSTAKEFLVEHLSDAVGEIKAENTALSYCMPFFSEISEDSVTAFNIFVKPLLDMKIEIGVVESNDVLITADYPVYIEAPDWNGGEYRKVIFPLTSKICLFFYGAEEKDLHMGNKLVPITSELFQDVIESMACRCESFIVSENRITVKQVKLFKNARLEMNDNYDTSNLQI